MTFRTTRLALAAVVGFAGVVSATAALAQAGGATATPTLSAAQYTVQAASSAPDYLTNRGVQDFQSVTNSTGAVLLSNSTSGVGSSQGSARTTSTQLLSVSGYAQADTTTKDNGVPFTLDDYSGGGVATLQYSLAVFGPTQEAVPLILMGYTQLSEVSGSQAVGSAQASYGITDSRNRNLWSVAPGSVATFSADCEVTNQNTDLSGCGTNTFQSVFTLNAWAGDFVGDQVNVHLYASAGGSSTAYGQFPDPVGQGGASAIIDPLVEIDPVWAAAHPGFSLAFSDGIENGAGVPPPGGGAVPEPAAWALMIAGFGLAGAALRRRRTAAIA